MKDSVLSVRIDEALKQQFVTLAQENGINNKELMELMLSQFALNQSTQSDQQALKEVEELNRITKRMVELYVNMLERSQLKVLEVVNQESSMLAKKEEQMKKLEEKVQDLLEKNTELTTLKDQVTVLKGQLGEQKSENENVKDLNSLLREKNKQLEVQVSEFEAQAKIMQGSKEQIAVLSASIDDQKELITNLNQRHEELEQLNKKLVQEIEVQGVKYADEKEEEIKHLKQQLELQYNQRMLEFKMEQQMMVQQLKDDHHQKIERLMSQNHTLMLQLQKAMESDK